MYSPKKKIINWSKRKELADKLFLLVFSLLFSALIFNIYKSIDLALESAHNVYEIERGYKEGEIVKMRPVGDISPEKAEAYIRSLAREVVVHLFPRTPKEADLAIEWLRKKSRPGSCADRRFSSILSNMEEYKESLEREKFIVLSPIRNSNAITISKKGNSHYVEVDMYFMPNDGKEKKFAPIKFYIEVVKAESIVKGTLGPGLLLESISGDRIVNFITGEKEEVFNCN